MCIYYNIIYPWFNYTTNTHIFVPLKWHEFVLAATAALLVTGAQCVMGTTLHTAVALAIHATSVRKGARKGVCKGIRRGVRQDLVLRGNGDNKFDMLWSCPTCSYGVAVTNYMRLTCLLMLSLLWLSLGIKTRY